MKEILGIGYIDIYKNNSQDLEFIINKFKEYHTITDVEQDTDYEHDIIYFTITGNNKIDYTPLNIIKDILLQKELDFTISVTEYEECETGYHYKSSK